MVSDLPEDRDQGWLAILMIVPIANVVMLVVLAFGEWPIHRELRQLKVRVMGVQTDPPV